MFANYKNSMESETHSSVTIGVMVVLVIFVFFFPFVLKVSSKTPTDESLGRSALSKKTPKYKINLKDYTTLMNNVCSYLESNGLGKIFSLIDIEKGYLLVYTIQAGSSYDSTKDSRKVLSVFNDIIRTVKVYHDKLKPTSHVIMNGDYETEQEQTQFFCSSENDLIRKNIWF